MKRFYRTAGLVVGVLATAAFAWYAFHALKDQDLSRFASTKSLLVICLAACIYSSIIPASAWAWQCLLKSLGVERPWRELVEIMAVTQFAKYIPGNVGVHLGRAGMALGMQFPVRPLISSLALEALLATGAALVVGATFLIISGPGWKIVSEQFKLSAVILICLLAALGVLVFLLGIFGKSFLRYWQKRWPYLSPKRSDLVKAFSTYSLNYVAIGIGVSLMAYVMLPEVPHDVALLCASFSLAWVAGFFTPGAPAGLGIREGLMLVILSSAYTQENALAIVVALRLATMLGDTLMLLLGSLLLFGSKRRASTLSTSSNE